MSIDRNRLEQEAMVLLQKGQIERALERYQTLLRDDHRDLRVRQKVADLYLKVGRQKEGVRHLREIARNLKATGKARRAIGVYKQLLRIHKDDWELRGDLGSCYLKAGFPRDAKACFRQVIDQISRTHPDKAIPYQEQLIRLDPGELALRIRLGELYEAANWTEKSLEHWQSLAVEARRLGRPDDRARFLENALRIREDDNTVRVEAAEARTDIGDYGGALAHLQRVAQEEPENGRALALLGRSLEGMEQRDKAQRVWLAAAQVAQREGEAEARAHALRRAVACGADDPRMKAELELADQIAARFSLRLDQQDWAAPQDHDSLRAVVSAETLARYGFPERGVESLEAVPDGLARALPVRVALVERLVDAGRTADALVALEAVAPTSAAAAADLQVRRAVLEGRGHEAQLPAPESEGVADDLIDDDLIDDDELLDEEITDEVPAGDELLDDELLDDDDLLEDEPDADPAPAPVEPPTPAAQPLADPAPTLDASFFEDDGPPAQDGPDFSSIFGDEPSFELPPLAPALQDARALLAVGALDQAEAAVADDASLGAALLRHEVLLRRAQPQEALRMVRDAVDDAPESDPHFKEALLVLAQLTAGAGRLRGAQRFLGRVTDLDPGWRVEEVARVRRGIALLEDG